MRTRFISAATPGKCLNLKSFFAILLLAAGILTAFGTFGIGPIAALGGFAMGKELIALIGNFTIGYSASYVSSMTFSPK